MNWDNVKSSTVPSLRTLGNLGAGSLAQASNFIKIEILRDFWQIISLFFEGLEDALPDSFSDVIGNFSVSISFCFSCWWSDDDTQQTISIVVFIIECVVAIFASFILCCVQGGGPDDQNQGLDVVQWTSRGRGYKKRLKYLLMLLTTLYLPVFRDLVLVLSCDTKFFPIEISTSTDMYGNVSIDEDDACSSGLYSGLSVLAVIVLLVFILPIPCILYKVVRSNRPKPKLFDAEGNARVGGYTDADYRADLDDDASPYKIVYDGYERDWAHYKVLALLIKISLVLPVVLFVPSNRVGGRDGSSGKSLLAVQSAWTIVVLLGYSALSTYSQPFIKDTDDQVDMVARFTALCIAVLGCIASQVDGGETAFGILLNVTTFVGGIIIIFYVISGFKVVQSFFKKLTQRVTFSMTRDTDEPMVFSKQLDVERERKFRIWHEFWNTLFAQDIDFRVPEARHLRKKKDDAEEEEPREEAPMAEEKNGEEDDKYEPKTLGYQYGGSPPFLLDFEGTTGERLEEMKEIIASESFKAYQMFLNVAVNDEDPNNKELMKAMRFTMHNLNGLDVFWDGQCVKLDKELSDHVEDAEMAENKSATHFGKMYIIPFPFCAVFLADDCDKTTALFSLSPVVGGRVMDAQQGMANVLRLAERNRDGEIVRRKAVRLRLRALEGSMCHWPIQKWKQKTISRQVSYTDSEGNKKTKTERKSVRVLFSFNDGNFGLTRHKTKAKWQELDITRGFGSHLQYSDGTGSHTESGWGTTNWSNEPYTLPGSEFGINDRFEESDLFRRFMGQNYRAEIHEPKRARIIADFARYAKHYRDTFVMKEHVLSSAFWYYIFNNDTITRDELDEMLRMERNDKVRQLADDGAYMESLGMVFDKLRFFNTSKRHSVWFTFWHDLWMNNLNLKIFEENEDLLSPFKGQSICYRFVESREALVSELLEKGLSGDESKIKHGWINARIIALLYDKMDELAGDGDEEQQHVIEVQQPRASGTVLLQPNTTITDEYRKAVAIMDTLCADLEDGEQMNEQVALVEEEKADDAQVEEEEVDDQEPGAEAPAEQGDMYKNY